MKPLELVRRLHATPHRTVIEFAGAGARALAWLHAVGGSSRTVLEATDRYASASLRSALDFEPERATSRRVAEALAAHAERRAGALLAADGAAWPRFGLASTATIATDREKRGEHRAVVAVCDPFGTGSWELRLAKGARDRSGEEEVVSRLLLRAAAEASGLFEPFDLGLLGREALAASFTPARPLAALAAERRAWARLEPDGRWSDGPADRLAILSGAFHPLHLGHRELLAAAAEHLGVDPGRAVFELPIRNADKGGIGLGEARRRASQFLGHAPLLLSRAPLFTEKADLYPGSVFVVGFDTAERVIDPRFYGGGADGVRSALERIRARGCRFLVAGRVTRNGVETFCTLADLTLPAGSEDLFEELPAERFRRDISSSGIRRGWGAAPA